MMQEIPHAPGALEPRGRPPRTYDFTTKLAAAPLPFGRFAVRRTTDDSERANLPSSAADVTLRPRGFVVQVVDAHLGGPVVLGYDQGSPVTLLRRGKAWMPVEAPVTQDGAVFARFAVGPGGSQLGALRGNDDSGTAAMVPRCSWETDGARNALLSVNL
jgi:hypothetical protein